MDTALAGRLLLYGASLTATWGAVASVAGRLRREPRLINSGRRGLYCATGLIVAAVIWLALALLRHDFSMQYVAEITSRSTPFPFVLTALWGGMAGSLLFWTLLTSIYATSAIAVQARRRPELVPIATGVLCGILAFFTAMVALAANPFLSSSPIPLDGAGLNPLLQSPFMNIHPVMLYLGFTGFAVPFAFAVSALVVGRLDPAWFTSTRRWTVLAWSFLTVGIILGGAWAYKELGWGGYWAWDPVENASLIPWLTATAFLHSVMIQERRGMLKIWNVALILATYCLAVLGTFLTRSGLLSSVHTFSNSPVGKFFLPFLAVLLIGSFSLLGWRLERLRSTRHLDSLLSRESMFLFNNLLFVAIAFTVLWGTLYPVVVEAISGAKISVGPPYFNAVVVPLGLALLALTGIGPLVAWRRASPRSMVRNFGLPLAVGAAVIVLLVFYGVHSAGAGLALGLCAFVTVTIGAEFLRGAKAHAKVERIGYGRALGRTISRNRRRYGGYIVHLGVVLIFLGLAGTPFKVSWSGAVSQGESFKVGAYDLKYVSNQEFAQPAVNPEKMVAQVTLDVTRGGHHITTLTPQRNFHIAQRQAQSEIGIRTTLSEDLYVVVTNFDVASGQAVIRAWVNPLVAWIWLGGVVMALGMIVILTGKPPTGPAEPHPTSVRKRRIPVPA